MSTWPYWSGMPFVHVGAALSEVWLGVLDAVGDGAGMEDDMVTKAGCLVLASVTVKMVEAVGVG